MSKYLLVGVGVFFAVVLGVAIYFLTVAPAPLSAAKTFIASVEANDFEAAYSKFHPDLRLRLSFPEFVEDWKGRSSSLNEANRSWSTDIENETAEVKGRFTTADGEEWSAVFHLIKQDGLWQIIDYEVQDGRSTSS
ncbi:MAG: DUF4878 domain-containing protein [Chloroflexi bacterium]|nr:DUF4878 domain-containing protein [Chloroflexota bacterium]